MPGWLTTATNVFRRKGESPPQTFEVRCGCGQSVSGQRTRTEQTATCPECATGLFVMPASVYPIPRSLAPKQVVSGSNRVADKESRATSPNSNTTDPAAIRRAARRSRPSTAQARISTAAPQPSFVERLREAVDPANLDRVRRKLLTPLRLVLMGVALVIVTTVWWMGHLRTLDRARDVLATVPRLAEESLQEGDAPEAARKFALLRQAVDLLGRDDPPSRRWRQLARETAAISDLAAAPLHDILQEAAESADGPIGSTWIEMFRANHRGGWILIDAPVSLATRASDGARYVVDFPLVAGEQRGRLIAELPALEAVVAADGSARRVIFAAQLADCRLESGPDPVWRIDLRPETGFLWSGADTYRMLGMPTDDDSFKVLAEQAHLMGIEP